MAVGAMSPALAALVDAMPYYADPDMISVHRGALITLLETNFPNAAVAAQPNDYGFGYSISYSYSGGSSGYQNAFFSGVPGSAVANAAAAQAQLVNSGVTLGWWGNYGVAALTDAIRITISAGVDTGHLANDLASNNATLLTCLSATYLAAFTVGFAPTQSALSAIQNQGLTSQCLAELTAAIQDNAFTANINQAIAMGGDSTNAAVWFLFNLWICLKALGAPNVDALITSFQAGGLTVPAEIGPGNWWTGQYTSWFGNPITGADILPAASSMITAAMPEQQCSAYAPNYWPYFTNTTCGNGYSQSLCFWGTLNWYNPPPSSCLGFGTGVFMADGRIVPIEEVRVGDEVASINGARRVALVESPQRKQRPLYRVDDLNLRLTAQHPVRTAEGVESRLAAVDPWGAIDTLPTHTSRGIMRLRAGLELHGFKEAYRVDRLTQEEGGDPDERVYDLILDTPPGELPVYFVGGPDNFIAVESEIPDVALEPSCTVGVVSALQSVMGELRAEKLGSPSSFHPYVSAVVTSDLSQMRGLPTLPADTVERVAVPGPDFYLVNGEWDPHASALEGELIRRFGRWLRRESEHGWRSTASPSESANRYTCTIYDIELRGEAAIRPGVSVLVHLQTGTKTASIDVPTREETQWHLRIDQDVSLGQRTELSGASVLYGDVVLDGVSSARFHARMDTPGVAEYFLFSGEGRVVGRIALEVRLMSTLGLTAESHRRELWGRRERLSRARRLGTEIGNRLLTHVKSPFG